LPDLVAEWAASAKTEWPPEALEQVFEYEWQFSPDELGRELLTALQRLEPFGVGNRRPLLRTGPLRLLGVAREFGEGHLKGSALTPAGHALALLGWRWAERAADLAGEFEALGYLEHDSYRDAPVFRLEDARPLDVASA
ncbi:MAG: hypothetical protein O7A98_00190, partial [Acidobacteria bacterium]|nr:hypothetical protein [Acidobacteriota bacterium]